LGARVENNQRFGTFTSLRSGAGVRLSRTTTLRAAAGTAFKEPTFTELSGGGFAKPNEELEPERSASWEVGVEQRVGGAVVVAATYFDQEFRDLIQFVPISDPDFFAQYRNAQSGYASGWELEARAGVVGRPTLRASLTILDPTIRGTGATPSARLPRRPNRSASIVLAVPTAAGLMLHTDIAFTGRRDDLLFDYDDGSATAVRMPSYTVVGLGATYAPPRSPTRLGRGTAPVEVMARVDNLFDTDYQAIAGFATPRRTASAGVRIGFGW
jgi:vitamin B12 transporter